MKTTVKHEPSNKTSVHSTKFLNVTGLPAKDREFKEFKALYPKTPIKWGEQEVISCMIPRDTRAVKELLDSYGVNETSEYTLEMELLTGNPFDINIQYPKTQSKNVKVNNAFFYGLGVVLEPSEDK